MTITTSIPESVLQLPPDYEHVIQTIVDTSMPRIDLLKPQQLTAFTKMKEYVNSKTYPFRMQLLEGYAGTGKTFTSAQLIKEIIIMSQKRIAITAPTNKAVKVLRRTTGYKHQLLSFRTIHALLGLKEDNDDNGKQIFVADYNEPREIEEVDVLIVDETSMLDDSLFAEINKCVETMGLKVIFMGDGVQIPPVNKTDCIPFIERFREIYSIERLELTDIVRQKEGNPILELATQLRTDVYAEQVDFPYMTQMTSQGGIIMISKSDKPSLYELCQHYFGNKRFNLDPDFVKVIAWTNKVVDFMNDKIRRMIYPDLIRYKDEHDKEGSLPMLVVGEKLIADKPIIKKVNTDWGEKDKIVFTTNDEFEIISYELTQVNMFGNFNVSVYRTTVRMYDENNKCRTETIDIVHESGVAVYMEVLNLLTKAALNERDKAERRKKWRLYFSIKNKVAHVKYNYAITAHKSQGSTYDNAIVIEPDIDKNPKIRERNRIKYVAYTRSRSLLFIVK